VVVDLACDVALEAAEGFFLGEALLGAAFDVVAGAGVVDHAGDDDPPQRSVGLAVTSTVEPVAFVLAAAGVDGGHTMRTVSAARLRLGAGTHCGSFVCGARLGNPNACLHN
jgi:hypothetical protein